MKFFWRLLAFGFLSDQSIPLMIDFKVHGFEINEDSKLVIISDKKGLADWVLLKAVNLKVNLVWIRKQLLILQPRF